MYQTWIDLWTYVLVLLSKKILKNAHGKDGFD